MPDKKQILIIDDNKEIHEVLVEILGESISGFESAYGVEDSIKLLREHKFDAILLDINLNGENGAQVAKFLQDTPNNKNNTTPIIITSGLITDQFVDKYFDRFAAIISKPFDFDLLRNTILEVIDEAENPKLKDPKDVIPPKIPVDLPFSIVDLDTKVDKVLGKIRKNPKLKKLFAKLKVDRDDKKYIGSHIGMLINITTGISNQMDWNTDKTLEKFLYASYLHDFILSDYPELAKIQTRNELDNAKGSLTELEQELVLSHSDKAFAVLETYPEIAQDVRTIVQQHHERPDGSGFPNKIDHRRITPLSSVFILAHDLCNYIIDNPDWKMELYLVRAKKEFRGPHFRKIINALSDI